MKKVLSKIAYGLLVAWGVISLIFFIFNVLPGDPASMMLGQRADQKSLDAIRIQMGLDKPAWKRYCYYLNDLSPISIYVSNPEDQNPWLKEKLSRSTRLISLKKYVIVLKSPWLGRSFQSGRPVSSMLGEALPNSLLLAGVSIILAFGLGTLLGVFSAFRKDSWADRSAIFLSTLGMSLPSFFAAILIAYLFAFKLGHISHLNLTGNLWEVDDLGRGMVFRPENIILPALTLGIRPLAVVLLLSRNSVLEVLGQDYIRTARAKGVSRRRLIFRHVLRNALNPVVTAVSGWFAGMLAGVVFIEYIFGWKGLGYMIVNALNFYDIPVVLGVVLVLALSFVLINIVVDGIYVLLDPRLRRSGS